MTTNTNKILIVEDEVLIARSIEKLLRTSGYEVLDNAISFEEAIDLFDTHEPDLALLDIQLSGSRTGIDVANYIRKKNKQTILIFLTSKNDLHDLNRAKISRPAGCLSKPVQSKNLLSMLKLALHSGAYKQTGKKEEPTLRLGEKRIKIADIRFLKAEHVYVRIYMKDGSSSLHRTTLSELHTKLPGGNFIRTHRSFVVNLNQVSGHNDRAFKLGNDLIPISRSKRQWVMDKLEQC